jgi:hypothetical protein
MSWPQARSSKQTVLPPPHECQERSFLHSSSSLQAGSIFVLTDSRLSTTSLVTRSHNRGLRGIPVRRTVAGAISSSYTSTSSLPSTRCSRRLRDHPPFPPRAHIYAARIRTQSQADDPHCHRTAVSPYTTSCRLSVSLIALGHFLASIQTCF